MRSKQHRFAVGRLEHLEHRIVPGGKTTNDVLMDNITGGACGTATALVPAEVSTLPEGLAVHQGLGGGTVANSGRPTGEAPIIQFINYGN